MKFTAQTCTFISAFGLDVSVWVMFPYNDSILLGYILIYRRFSPVVRDVSVALQEVLLHREEFDRHMRNIKCFVVKDECRFSRWVHGFGLLELQSAIPKLDRYQYVANGCVDKPIVVECGNILC